MKQREILLVVGFVTFALLTAQKRPIDHGPYDCPDGQVFDRYTMHCEVIEEVREINGHSVEEILAILDRHRAELHAIYGVTATGVDRHGPFVEVERIHDRIPDAIEGIPLAVYPAFVAVGL